MLGVGSQEHLPGIRPNSDTYNSLCAHFILVTEDGAKAPMGHIFYCFIVAVIGFIVLPNCLISVKVDVNFCDALWDNPFFRSFLHLLIQVSVEINVLPPYPTVVTGSPVFSLLVFLLTRAQAERLLGDISESFHDVIGWVFSGNCGFNKL